MILAFVEWPECTLILLQMPYILPFPKSSRSPEAHCQPELTSGLSLSHSFKLGTRPAQLEELLLPFIGAERALDLFIHLRLTCHLPAASRASLPIQRPAKRNDYFAEVYYVYSLWYMTRTCSLLGLAEPPSLLSRTTFVCRRC